jgi:glutathione S-transferase
MTDIVFYHNPQSRGRIAHWMLEEVGVPYKTELLSFDKRDHKTPSFLALNPMGKIPTLKHGNTVVTEAGAVCAYLADAFPAANLAPALDRPERGTYYRWLFFGAGCIEPALVDRMFKRPPVERAGALGYGSYDDTLNALEQAITPGPFILGDHFTAADVYIASEIGWGMLSKSLEPRESFQKYFARCSQRPAFKRAAAQDEQYMKEMNATA